MELELPAMLVERYVPAGSSTAGDALGARDDCRGDAGAT
jgi:hypothetical protein